MKHNIQLRVPRSDNGNEFLCLQCRNAKARSGQLTQLEVWCTAESFLPEGYASKVPFPVTKCDSFRRIDPSKPSRAELTSLQKQAWYVVTSEEGKGTTLIPPDVAKRRDLYDD